MAAGLVLKLVILAQKIVTERALEHTTTWSEKKEREKEKEGKKERAVKPRDGKEK